MKKIPRNLLTLNLDFGAPLIYNDRNCKILDMRTQIQKECESEHINPWKPGAYYNEEELRVLFYEEHLDDTEFNIDWEQWELLECDKHYKERGE